MKKILILFSLITCIFLFAQESVTKNYLAADNIASAKNFAKIYNDTVLAKKYTIRNIGNPESNNYDVEYKVGDESGTAVMILNFNFRERDFTITLKSMNYINKKTGAITAISNRSTIPSVQDYYERTKKLLLTLHSGYISPDLNK